MGYISTGTGDRFCALIMFLMALELMLVDQKPFQYVFFFKFLSPDIHKNWHFMMSTHLSVEVKQQWATLVLGWVTI